MMRFRWLRLGLLMLLLTSCGYSDGGGGRIIGPPVVGGSLPPSPMAYALTAPSDVAQARVDDDELPMAVDLRRDGVVPPVQNQAFNACVGWTLGYFLMTGLEARHYRTRGYVLDIQDEANWFSPDYVYSQRETTEDAVRAFCHLTSTPICLELDGRVGCMRPEAALDALMRNGCAPWACLCGDDGAYRTCDPSGAITAPGESIVPWSLAEPCGYFFRPRCYVRFGQLRDPSIRGGTVRKMQSWLHTEGTPIAAVVRMRQNWLTYRGQNRVTMPVLFRGRSGTLTEERSVCLDAGGTDLGSQHMMAIIGYDRNFPDPAQVPGARPEHRGSFLVANQWGDKWGDDGLMWIPAVELEKIWVGGYGLIKWQWNTPVPGEGVVCAQNEQGEWVRISDDGDDVPMNLDAPDPCGDPTDDRVVKPVGAMDFDGATATSGQQTVGGSDARQVIDSADWYRIEVPEGMTRIDATLVGTVSVLGQERPLRRVLDVRITDEELQDLTQKDPTTLEAQAYACHAGRYFIKVQPNTKDLYGNLGGQDPAVTYELRVTLTPGQAECNDTPGAAGEETAPLRVHAFGTQTLPAGETAPRRFHWFDARNVAEDEGWGRGTRIQVEVTGVTPGAEIELVVGGIQSPRHRPIDVMRVDSTGGSLIVEDESVIVSPPDIPRVLAVTRSLTPALDVSYDLTIRVLPARGSAPPERTLGEPVTAVSNALASLHPTPSNDATQWGWLRVSENGGADAVLVMQEEWGYRDPTNGWRDHVLELKHACAAPSITLVDEDGEAVGSDVYLTDVGRTGLRPMSVPGVTYMRLVVPADVPVNSKIMAVIRDESGEPLREYSLRTLLQPSLRTWPFVEGAENAADGAWDANNGPATPLRLDLGVPHADRIGYFTGPNGASWDLFDYFAVTNSGDEKTLHVTLSKNAGHNLDVRWWDAEGTLVSNTVCASDTYGEFALPMDPGETRVILVYSGAQAATDYTISVCEEQDGRAACGDTEYGIVQVRNGSSNRSIEWFVVWIPRADGSHDLCIPLRDFPPGATRSMAWRPGTYDVWGLYPRDDEPGQHDIASTVITVVRDGRLLLELEPPPR